MLKLQSVADLAGLSMISFYDFEEVRIKLFQNALAGKPWPLFEIPLIFNFPNKILFF